MKPASSSLQTTVVIKSAYSPTEEVALKFPDEEYPYGKTKQSFADDADINNIMARYQSTGMIDYVKENAPHYGDVTGLEFQACMDKIIEASEMFDALPAQLRKRFNNEPAEFLDFVQDDKNRDEAITLGLIPEAPKAPITVPEGHPTDPKTPGGEAQ